MKTKGIFLMKTIILLIAVTFVAGCAGKLDYIRPNVSLASKTNQVIIDKPMEGVWKASVPELGKQFFVINNIDKSSGLINISYTGDPEKYVDCGRVISYVKNARGERTYDFAGAKAQQVYEIMNGGELFNVQRKMSLEGRVNLVFEELNANQTKITANTRYVIQRNLTVVRSGNNFPQSAVDSIAFNSGSPGSFASRSDGRATECISNGALEKEILSTIR